jgi:hypothetical protein
MVLTLLFFQNFFGPVQARFIVFLGWLVGFAGGYQCVR